MREGPELGAPAEGAPPGDARYLLVFRVGGSLYALEGALVDHVSERGRIVPVPTAPACFAGVVHERGRVLAVVDLVRVFGADGERATDGYRRLVVVELAGRPLVLLAHEVLGLREVAAAELRPASRGDAIAAAELADARGVITLLDPDELLHRLRSGAEARDAS